MTFLAGASLADIRSDENEPSRSKQSRTIESTKTRRGTRYDAERQVRFNFSSSQGELPGVHISGVDHPQLLIEDMYAWNSRDGTF